MCASPSPASPPAPATARTSATERTYAAIKHAILVGDLPGGEELGEVALAERLGCSRTPVREALLRLQTEGLVRIYPKKGAIVLPVTSAEADSMWEARSLVEQWAAPRSFAEGTRIRPRLEELVAAMEEHRADDDLAAFTESDRLFHEVVVDAAGNPHLSRFYRSLRERQMMINAAAMGLSPARMDRAVRDHHELVALISGDDLDAFVTANDRHLATARHAVQGGLGEDA
ncbi:GntR family transcriptional regulator [Mumia zhuanghuii]|uniref:GntR family transcriptional regulator n=1 Tax=Mumia zhuanghuii TaxID=2585211 RepID=A0A5C4MNU9_9ACTN|nr:GntR family transcriptional regulator [Mumia zhuanghuii]TNC47038.1 GntR family transcriptional regulator [Mumia zhuanghuii]TNC47268.1 GntR family transcriptional regulator [Mumia zhuanghuii]